MTTLTERQQRVLTFVQKHIEETGYPPSGREIQRHLKIAGVSAAQKHVAALIRKGFLHKGEGPRALKLAHHAHGRSLPIIGQVAAGLPITAEENVEGTMTIDPSMAKWEGCFLLRVKGDSMKDAAILHRDLVVVKPQPEADSQDIVVALLDQEATVKRLVRKKKDLFLVPANPLFKPIKMNDYENSRILGKVVGVIRTLRP
jgi:repressor LexA